MQQRLPPPLPSWRPRLRLRFVSLWKDRHQGPVTVLKMCVDHTDSKIVPRTADKSERYPCDRGGHSEPGHLRVILRGGYLRVIHRFKGYIGGYHNVLDLTWVSHHGESWNEKEKVLKRHESLLMRTRLFVLSQKELVPLRSGSFPGTHERGGQSL